MGHYSDSRHGWVAVKRETLQAWGLADKISSYSYQSKAGGTIYLEEDGDATLFFKEAEARGYKVSVTEKDTTVVRGYPRYQP